MQNSVNSFFILGCPRSGTTLLRDILRQDEEIYAPEETHFYRIAAPYGGVEFMNFYKNNPIMQKHRKLDGVSDGQFGNICDESYTRFDLACKYSSFVAKSQGAKYWFDKTPQNVYGLPLLLKQFPDAKYLHLVRHPLSVVKSLMEGKVMKSQSFIGSLNYWLEAVSIIDVMKPLLINNLLEIKYEELQRDPAECIKKVLSHLGKKSSELKLDNVRPPGPIPQDYFKQEELEIARNILGDYPAAYGYEIYN